jgi:sn-glycerol 3-phosphate transport system substrate-binding protein
MRVRLLAAALAAAGAFAAPAQAQKEIQFWHSMGAALGERTNELAAGFNASQSEYKVVAVYKGSYPESMTAAIAAFRAGNPPHIVQVFEVGTATMMAAKGAVKPVYQMMKEAGEPFDPKRYLAAVAGYYTDPKGNLLSMPFNSSTPVFYVNKDVFKKHGLDAENAPKTWKDVAAVAAKMKAGGQDCIYTTSWPSWVHIENFSAWHNVPIGTKSNGFGGMDTRFTINSPAHVKHLSMLGDFAKKGYFTYAGLGNKGDAKFSSGECAMFTGSSGAQATLRKLGKFDYSVNFLPYHDDLKGAPQNSIIGGATLWVLAQKDKSSYKGIAKFFTYLSSTEVQAKWHQQTGYAPITNAAYDATQASGYYKENPGTDVSVRQLNYKTPTANSKGLRFGNFVQGRQVIEEEMEQVFAGKKDAKAALDDAVKRANDILDKFAAANK